MYIFLLCLFSGVTQGKSAKLTIPTSFFLAANMNSAIRKVSLYHKGGLKIFQVSYLESTDGDPVLFAENLPETLFCLDTDSDQYVLFSENAKNAWLERNPNAKFIQLVNLE